MDSTTLTPFEKLRLFLQKPRNSSRVVYFSFWLVYFGVFWSRVLNYDADNNLIVHHVGIWGDWASHVTMGSAMAYRDLFLNTNPILITAPFNYPFITNLISALLIRVGVPFFMSFTIPSFVFCMGLVVCLYLFYKKVFQSISVAIVSSLLFFFNGGLGFKLYFDELAEATKIKSALLPLNRYTNFPPKDYYCGNVIDNMMIPQRAFTLGFPLALIILMLMINRGNTANLKKVALAGILLGFMPIIHSHAFMCAAIILFCWFLLDINQQRKNFAATSGKSWALFWTLSVSLGSALVYTFLLSKNMTHDFLKWFPGWYSREIDINWFYFWWINWGLMPFVATIAALVFYRHRKEMSTSLSLAYLFVPFLVLLVALNLVLFQPWVWDNTKIWIWVCMGFSGMAGWFLVFLWRENQVRSFFSPVGKMIFFFKRSLCVFLFVMLTLSGILDAVRLQSHERNTWTWYTDEDFQLANWVEIFTPANSIWLTSDKHNHWLYNLTGRQPVMGYEGWVWTYGFETGSVPTDIRELYRNPDRKDLIDKYKIDYIVVGPTEQILYSADLPGFEKNYKRVFQTDETVLFKTDK